MSFNSLRMIFAIFLASVTSYAFMHAELEQEQVQQDAVYEISLNNTPGSQEHEANLQIQDAKIAYMSITGLSFESVQTILSQIRVYAHDPAIGGVLIKIDCRGGQLSLGECVFREIKMLNAIKPVVILIFGEALSMGYLIATAGSWIVAPSLSMVGEIGVIQEVARRTHCRLNRSDLVADVELELIQAGKHIYAPDADLLTLAERDAIQSVVNKDYKWFVDTVAEQRQISIDSSFDWAEGREFTGDQALEQKLIDQVGSYSDAIGKLKELMQQSLGK